MAPRCLTIPFECATMINGTAIMENGRRWGVYESNCRFSQTAYTGMSFGG